MDILLGAGKVSIGGTPIGLTRGGSAFVTEREIREIEADGDKGPVKGRIKIDREVAKLTVNALEIFDGADMSKYYPALSVTPDTEVTPTKNIMTSTLEIADTDYNDITWTGVTKAGRTVIVSIQNAINLGNIDWAFEDKGETVPALEFTATYIEEAMDTPPWDVAFDV